MFLFIKPKTTSANGNRLRPSPPQLFGGISLLLLLFSTTTLSSYGCVCGRGGYQTLYFLGLIKISEWEEKKQQRKNCKFLRNAIEGGKIDLCLIHKFSRLRCRSRSPSIDFLLSFNFFCISNLSIPMHGWGFVIRMSIKLRESPSIVMWCDLNESQNWQFFSQENYNT